MQVVPDACASTLQELVQEEEVTRQAPYLEVDAWRNAADFEP